MPAQPAGYMRIRTIRRAKMNGKPVGGGYRRLGSLADTCWVTANGQQVCGAGDPTGQTTTPVCLSPTVPQNNASGSQVAPDRTTWQWTQSGTSLSGNPASHNLRRYVFKYHSGLNDVWAQNSGGSCSPFACNYVIVGPGGAVSFAGSPPPPAEPPCATTATAATPTVSSGCYTDPVSGAEVCGSGVVNTFPTAENTYPYDVGYSSGYPYSPIETNTGSGYSAAPTTQVAAPAPSSSSSLSNIPTWALVGGAAVGGILLMKMLKR